jgi:hypothetical protein
MRYIRVLQFMRLRLIAGSTIRNISRVLSNSWCISVYLTRNFFILAALGISFLPGPEYSSSLWMLQYFYFHAYHKSQQKVLCFLLYPQMTDLLWDVNYG